MNKIALIMFRNNVKQAVEFI